MSADTRALLVLLFLGGDYPPREQKNFLGSLRSPYLSPPLLNLSRRPCALVEDKFNMQRYDNCTFLVCAEHSLFAETQWNLTN
jgi:hypothetical protein